MIERRLSKQQRRVFVALARERQRLQAAFQEVIIAEQQQVEMLRAYYDLPDGQYQIREEANGTAVLFRVPDPPAEADKDPDDDPLIEG